MRLGSQVRVGFEGASFFRVCKDFLSHDTKFFFSDIRFCSGDKGKMLVKMSKTSIKLEEYQRILRFFR